MSDTRIEKDSMGPIAVPAAHLWGAQTQRSLEHFRISEEKMPRALIVALAQTKRAAARVNMDLGLLPADKGDSILQAADEVLNGLHASEFPLAIWQTGSGTQTNMNMNEVLANRASEVLGGVRGNERLVHPNDDVNKSQSSNDVFPTAMHVAAVTVVREHLLPELKVLQQTLADKAVQFADIVKCDAADAGAGDFRLGGDADAQPASYRKQYPAPVRTGVGRHRGRHRIEHAPGIRGAGGGGTGLADRSPVCHRAEQV